MNNSPNRIGWKASLLLLLLFLSFGREAAAQSRFPAILLGEGNLNEITQLPEYPTSNFVAVQFCGLRDKCTVTTYYVDKLMQQGIDISFFPVFDRIQESMTTMSDNSPVKAVIDWGMHVTSTAADQVYLIDANKTVVYQGTLKELDGSILAALTATTLSSSQFTSLINNQPASPGNSRGIWLYKDDLHPMQLKVGEFLAISIRGARVELSNEIAKKLLPKTSFQRGYLIARFLTTLGYTVSTQKSQRYHIKVTGATSTNGSNREDSLKWQELLNSLTVDNRIIISNYSSLPPSLANITTKEVQSTLSPERLLETLQLNGLKFQVTNSEEINLIKIN